MRVVSGYILMVLISLFEAVSPAKAAAPESLHPANAAVVQSTAALNEKHPSSHCDQPEDTEAIAAAYQQQQLDGPFLLLLADHFHAGHYPRAAAPLSAARRNIRRQPHYRLILFPFHGFW